MYRHKRGVEGNGRRRISPQRELRTQSVIGDRMALAQQLGQLTFGDKRRDVYTAAGYDLTISHAQYLARFLRQDVAQRVVSAAVDETWRKLPTLLDGKDAETGGEGTPFTDGWLALTRAAADEAETRRGLASGKLGGASSVAADDEGAAVVQSSAPSSRASNPDLGKCRVCHRPLTDPASAASGIGPCCAAKLAAGGGDDLAVGGDLLAAVHLHLTALVDALPALRTEFRHDPTGIGLVAKLQAAVSDIHL